MAAPAGYRQTPSGFWVGADGSGPYVFDGVGMTLATPGGASAKIANLNAVVVTTETTILAPTAGKRFQIVGFFLTGGVVAGNVLLKDNTGGTTILILPFGAAGQTLIDDVDIESAAVNNVLTATGAATQTLSGYIEYNEL